MSNSQVNKLKSGIKNGIEKTLDLSSNIIGDSNDETNFLHKLLLTNTQASGIRKAFANGSSANKIFSKTQMSKMLQLRGFLGTIGTMPHFLLNLEHAPKKYRK